MKWLARSRIIRWLITLAMLALAVYAVMKLDWNQLQLSLGRARYGLLILAVLVPFVHIWTKSERWRLLLKPIARVPWLSLYHTLFLSFAASTLLPARAGEGLRVWVLRRRYKVPVSSSVGVILVEKVLEIAGLLLITAPLPFIVPLPHWIKVSILALLGIGVAAVLALLVIARVGDVQQDNLIGRLAQAVRCIGSWKRLLLVIGWSVVTYSIDTVMITLVLHAYAIPCHWAAPLLVLLTVNVAIALPSTPAQIGIFEAGAVAGLTAFGVPSEQALAFAVTYHFVQITPILLVGLLTGMPLLAETRRQIQHATEDTPADSQKG